MVIRKSLFPLGRCLSLAALIAAVGCSQERQIPTIDVQLSAVPVTAESVQFSEVAIPVEATGILARQAEAELAFKSSGVVGEVLVRAGDVVEKGQILARLKLDELEASVAQARANLEKTHRDVARARQLLSTQVFTLEQVQNAETQEEQAAAGLRSAEFNLRHALIEAPAAGRILRRRAEPNQTLAAGTPILDFAAETEGWLIRVSLSDRDVQRVHVGDSAEWASGDAAVVHEGRIAHIAEANEPVTRTTEVEVRVDQVPPGLRSGFVTHVTLHPQRVASRPSLPTSAIVEGAGDTAAIFLVQDRSAHRVLVKTESRWGDRVFLRTPLPTGAMIVVAGAEFLRDAQPVQISPAVTLVR